MQQSILCMAVLALASASGVSKKADAQPWGTWKTPVGAEVVIERCGAEMCGRLLSSPALRANPQLLDDKNRDRNLRGRKLKGLVFLVGFTGGPRKWSNGRLYNAEDGRTYSGSVEVISPTTIALRGCVAAVFCRSQTWTRLR